MGQYLKADNMYALKSNFAHGNVKKGRILWSAFVFCAVFLQSVSTWSLKDNLLSISMPSNFTDEKRAFDKRADETISTDSLLELSECVLT